MSIHKIKYSEKRNPESPDVFIQEIVDQYNAEHKEENQKYKLIVTPEYKPEEHRGFKIQPYYSSREYETNFGKYLNSFGAKEAVSGNFSTHFLYFLYRRVPAKFNDVVDEKAEENTKIWEVFAITSNEAWQAIAKYRDRSFPTKITKRVVDPELSTSDSKHLAGLKNSSSETYREGVPAQRNEIQSTWQIFKSFSSHFKVGSSMYRLEVFKSLNKKISVQIQAGAIRINYKMTISSYEEIIEHFGKIDRGEKTFIKVDDKLKEEDDDTAFSYLEYIQPVRYKDLEGLNKKLMEIIWNFQSGTNLQGITFGHKYYRDFYGSSCFELKYQTKTLKKWYHHPSFCEVCEVLKEGLQVKDFEEFSRELDKVKFKYYKKPKYYPIKEFFQGEVKLENKMYFRNDGTWFQSKAEHLAIIQKSFLALLKSHLLRSNEPGYLQKAWIAKEEWASFSLQDVVSKTQESEEHIKSVINELKDKEFSLIDEHGTVKVSSISSVVLIDKLHKKNKEAIECLLKEKEEDKSLLKLEDIQNLLNSQPKVPKANQQKEKN